MPRHGRGAIRGSKPAEALTSFGLHQPALVLARLCVTLLGALPIRTCVLLAGAEEMAMRVSVLLLGFLSACTTLGSTGAEPRREEPRESPIPEPPRASAASAEPLASPAPSLAELSARYSWLPELPADAPPLVDTLDRRFPAPPGFSRVPLAPESFGAFLRSLPLVAKGTPVVSYRGAEIRRADHPNVAAVVAIDIGRGDLQQCADAVLRMHAEWRWSHGHREHAYRSASGTNLVFSRYVKGERARASGSRLSLVPTAPPAEPTHALFREWLDEVFGWTNTGALARDAARVPLAELGPGDFFVVTGVPFGHTVLVLDVARDARGRRALLLGQSFVPAQSVHVLAPSSASPWFVLDEAAGVLDTPFWDPFPFDSLRRLPE